MQPPQNMFNAKFQEPATGARGQTGREPAPADEAGSMTSARPVMDSKGNVAYEPKHRKPKWAMHQPGWRPIAAICNAAAASLNEYPADYEEPTCCRD